MKVNMKKDKILFVSFTLFSMFFGAGNLIFPPFLGQNAGSQSLLSVIGFLITAVVLPVLAVIVVVKADGMDNLTSRAGRRFGTVFTIMLYLAIGPGLAIPRAASVPFEMSIAPYLPQDSNTVMWMVAYSVVFFAVSAWLSLNPGKLVDRLGSILTPLLIVLIVVMFVSFVIRGQKSVGLPQDAYAANPFLTGFSEGYLTMDAIAGLVFAAVVAKAFKDSGIEDKKESVAYCSTAGAFAGIILALIYIMLSYMGMQSGGVYALGDNGAQILRQIVHQLFGGFGAVILAAIFALACLTTCVGLITAVSEFFAKTTDIAYNKMVVIITLFSLVICNYGLNTILSISIPVLNAVYPATSVIIVLGLFDRFFADKKYTYILTMWGTAAISTVYALENIIPLGPVTALCSRLPFYSLGFGWITVTVAMLVCGLVIDKLKKV